jgi:L-alanine-DL-glutamate epimerase-like enolase superfamily enzyme
VIDDVQCFSCVVPLPHPLQVGSAVVSSRQYDIVRLRSASGLTGAAYAFGRGLPITPIIERSFAPLLLGASASSPEAVRRRLHDAYWPYAERGLFSVAASAVDLALWDLLGSRLGAPLADLLGRARSEVPICGVGGYQRYGTEGAAALADLQRDMAGFIDLGCQAVKLTVGAASPRDDARRVAAVREVVGPDCAVVVDAFRSYRSIEDAIRRARLLEPFDLAYLEDPFPDSLTYLAAELRHKTRTLVALGENLNGHRAFHQLIASGAVDVVRCDATVVGGVREFMACASLASARGLEVSTHVHPAVHVHFAAALSNIHRAGLEYMPPDSGLDALHQLVQGDLEVRSGCATVGARPGLGIEWDWDAVKRFARA